MVAPALEALSHDVWVRLQHADALHAVEDPVGYLQRLATEIDPAWVAQPLVDDTVRPMQEAINCLSRNQRELLHLHVQHGLSYAEIGQARGVAPDRVLYALVDAYITFLAFCDPLQ